MENRWELYKYQKKKKKKAVPEYSGTAKQVMPNTKVMFSVTELIVAIDFF